MCGKLKVNVKRKRPKLTLDELKILDQSEAKYCPNNHSHKVFGDVYSQWYCAECGIEWKPTSKGDIHYSLITIDGCTADMDRIPIEKFLTECTLINF